jgi:hypothetical protein
VPAQKPILLNANYQFIDASFVLAQNVCDVTMCKQLFGTTQKIWTGIKHVKGQDISLALAYINLQL